MFNANVSVTTDEYEWFASHKWNDMQPNVCHSLTQSLLYPQVLQHVLRAPTPLAARIALELDKLSVFPDGTSSTKYVKQVWEYIHGRRSRSK
jgi:protease II